MIEIRGQSKVPLRGWNARTGSMVHYRFYFLDQSGHIVGVDEHEAVDDVAALEAAQKLCTRRPMEIWDGSRRVAQVERDGNAPA
jgi:hypothetical protein